VAGARSMDVSSDRFIAGSYCRRAGTADSSKDRGCRREAVFDGVLSESQRFRRKVAESDRIGPSPIGMRQSTKPRQASPPHPARAPSRDLRNTRSTSGGICDPLGPCGGDGEDYQVESIY
jgi:hypothetical protein